MKSFETRAAFLALRPAVLILRWASTLWDKGDLPQISGGAGGNPGVRGESRRNCSPGRYRRRDVIGLGVVS